MTKPKLLLISGISPFPQTSGGATRIKQTLLHLSKKYEIYFFYFTEKNFIIKKDDRNFLIKNTVYFEPIECGDKSIASSLRTGIPYHFFNYFNNDLIVKLIEIQKKINFDEIRVESTQLLYLQKFLKIKNTIFVALDVSIISFWRRAFESINPLYILIRLFSFIQVYLYEKKHLKKFKEVLIMSMTDMKYVRKIYGIKNLKISQNGIDAINFLPNKENDILTIGFIGSCSHSPNKKAIEYLLKKISPQLIKIDSNAKILILGRNNKGIFKIKNNTNVEFIEYIKNLKDFYSQIDILVAPIFSGSGTRVKILESLSFGRPVITTFVGSEGIKINSNLLYIIPKNKQKKKEFWIDAIINIYNKSGRFGTELLNLRIELEKLLWTKTIT